MGWTLDREFFRLLVGLYLVTLVLATGIALYETVGPGWSAFSSEFDALVKQHFGAVGDAALLIAGCILLVSLIWHVASLFWLRRFRPWARWSFWVSIGIGSLAAFAPGIAMPTYASSLGTLTAEIGTGLFASILLLAYSRDHGGQWFKGPLETLKDTF